MRNFAVGMIALLALALGSLTSLAGDRRIVIDVPFQFTVGEKTLPAGSYLIEQEPQPGGFFKIRSVKGGHAAVVLAGAVAEREEASSKPALVFNDYAGERFLSKIFMPYHAAGNEIKKSGEEEELSARVSASTVLVVAVR